VQGKPRYDFTGKLSMSWPKSAAQTKLNVGQQHYAPLFAYGYGLNYQAHRQLAQLSELSGVTTIQSNTDNYFVGGRTPKPWRFVLRQNNQSVPVPNTAEPFNAGSLTIDSVDAGGLQEGGKQVTWAGQSAASVVLAGAFINLVRQANADVSLQIEYRVDQAPTAAVSLAMGCGSACASVGALKLDPVLSKVPLGEWQILKVKLACFRDKGADLLRIAEPMVITTAGRMQLSIGSVRLETDPANALCLGAVNGY